MADSNDLPRASTAVGGGGGNNDGRQGRMLTGKGREPAATQRQARAVADGQGTRAGATTSGKDTDVQGTRAGAAANNNGIKY